MRQRRLLVALIMLVVGAAAWVVLRPEPAPRRSLPGAPDEVQVAKSAISGGEGEQELTVRVLSGVDGRALSGAAVRVLSRDGRLLGEAVSADDGVAALGRAGEGQLVTASHPAEGLGSAMLAPGGGQVVVFLPGCGHRLHGTISDASGGVISGATVCEVVSQEGATGGCGSSSRDGTYSLCLWSGRRSLRVAADSYATLDIEEVIRGTVRRDVDLVPAARIRGRVMDGGGEGVSGAVVVAESASEGGLARAGGGKAFSGLDGSFEMADLMPGDYVLAATHGAAGSARVLATATAGPGDLVTLVLSSRPMVRGRVTDGVSPVVGAFVSLRTVNSFEETLPSVTSADGSFVIERSPLGEAELAVEQYIVLRPGRIVVAAGGARDVDVLVTKGGAISGRVLRQGRGVVRATVFVSGRGGEKPVTTWTDAAGAFRVQGLAAGTYSVAAQSEALAAFSSPRANVEVLLQQGEQRAGVDVRLDASARVVGVVRELDGAAVVGAEVVFKATGKEDLCGATTDGDGRFVCAMLEGDAHYVPVVRFSSRSRRLLGAPGGAPFGQVFVPSDGSVNVDLVVDARRALIAGRVVDEAGAAVPDVLVTARDPGGVSAVSVDATGSDGSFSLIAVRGERYNLFAHAGSGALASRPDVVADGTFVELQLSAAVRVRGRLVGFPDETVRVIVQRVGSSEPREALVTDLHYESAALLPGSHVVVAQGGGKSAAELVALAKGQVATVDLAASEDRDALVQVRDFETDAPIAGTRCRASRTEHGVVLFGSALSVIGTSDDAGQIRARLPYGRVEVSCEGRYNRQTNGVSLTTVLRGGADPVVVVRVVQKAAAGPANSAGLRLSTEAGPWLGELGGVTSVIREVRAGSRAATAGVQVGDVLVKVGAADVRALTGWGISWLLGKSAVGTRIAIVVVRDGAEKSYTVEVEPPWAD